MPAKTTTDGDWRGERSCPICWTTFAPAGPRHRYCCDRCRKAGHQRRQNHPRAESRRPSQTPTPVASRACPHCGEQVSIVALLTTPEAARPAVPDPSVVRYAELDHRPRHRASLIPPGEDDLAALGTFP